MTQPGIEARSPGPLANTQTIMPMSGSRQNIVTKKKIIVQYSKQVLEQTVATEFAVK